MGMQKKLDQARQEGFDQGREVANEYAEIRGHIQGASETWQLMEDMFLEIDGIGPKTRGKILNSIQKYAQKEKEKIESKMRK